MKACGVCQAFVLKHLPRAGLCDLQVHCAVLQELQPTAACLYPHVQCPCAASDDDATASDGMPDMEAFPPEAVAALDAFDEAAGRPQAYLQPSKQVAELARLAAKVGLLCNLFIARLHVQEARVEQEGTCRPLALATHLPCPEPGSCMRQTDSPRSTAAHQKTKHTLP